jgi:hypothetical protein
MHLELFLELSPDADRDHVQEHLRSKGLEPLLMKTGFALSADVEALKRLLPQRGRNRRRYD